jgi:hypothetical protein
VNRTFRFLVAFVLVTTVCPTATQIAVGEEAGPAESTIDIGNRLELFVDDHLIATRQGDVDRYLCRPLPREVVLVTDAPWEGNTSGYFTLFRDGDLYRMIYRGWQHDAAKKAIHPEITCYAESRDGISWIRPNVGLFEWEGSKENNIVWRGEGSHNFTAFRDDNPSTPDVARYKALGGGSRGLLAFQSPDCKKWTLIREQPILTHGAFDSQNLAFWDQVRGEYRAYWRYFTAGQTDQKNWRPAGVRAIRTATSDDFIRWKDEADLTYGADAPAEHLYTNAISKYFRAPHLFIGFPTRYLPKQGERVEPVLMISRDGGRFDRWEDAVIPEDAPADRKGNRSNYMAWGMFQIPGKPNEISVYATENYFGPTPGRLRRFAYRVDGFVALRSGEQGGIVTTKPLRYQGQRLLLNYVVHPGGSLLVEILDSSGKVIGRSRPIVGDKVDATVQWDLDPSLSEGVIQLRLVTTSSDVYSMRFD